MIGCGVRYPLAVLLTIALLAKLAGDSQVRAIADSQEERYGGTSAPASVVAIVRGHWQIENGLHDRRDVTFARAALVSVGMTPHS
jgi:predicted transposase YbfD/YdcC